jgi:(1->4)-alpha-D-glucan 1-alpha-D-glucosylmutase
VGKAVNLWWLDLLKKGNASRYADYFDIDWNAPGLEGKVFAPFLGEAPEIALAKGDLRLIEKSGEWMFVYFDHRFPLRPEDQQRPSGDPEGLLARQNFVLADWREADARLNWRRFFDITDLAAIRPGLPEVFEATHAKILKLYSDDLIQGVRVDHVDGIADPGAYCRTLRERLEALRPGAYIVVEKILADGEVLPAEWRVDGTTGYDFMNEISALEHWPDHGALESMWQYQSRRGLAFDEEEQRARGEMLLTKFAAQRAATVRAFARILPANPDTIDAALIAIITRLRCYRSYATGGPGSPGVGSGLDRAFARAASDLPHMKMTLDAIASLFAGRDGAPLVTDAIRRFSQLSAPVAAKAVEDTAFYRYGRILSRNDVGFDPRRHVMDVGEFHGRMAARASSYPSAMLATATHDHKRGEDARARIAVLSYMPAIWADFIAASPAPADIDSADAYQLYQTLLGAWPVKPPDREFAKRIQGWCLKYLREAKLRSSWTAPSRYEVRFGAFATNLVLATDMAAFRERFSVLRERIRPFAQAHMLLQTVLRNCAPGVPDLYQGCEFDDFSLVDPDNRRPVDFAARARALEGGSQTKQNLIARLLAARRDNPDLWARGDYLPIPFPDDHVLAFSRSYAHSQLILVGLSRPEATTANLQLARPYRELLTGKVVGPGRIELEDLFKEWSATVLYADGRA